MMCGLVFQGAKCLFLHMHTPHPVSTLTHFPYIISYFLSLSFLLLSSLLSLPTHLSLRHGLASNSQQPASLLSFVYIPGEGSAAKLHRL